MQQTSDLRGLRKAVAIYHSFPSVIAVLLVGVFLAVIFVTNSYTLAFLAAAVPTMLLLWRWTVAAKMVDKSVCPRCGKSYKGKLTWIYPPKTCPHCGAAAPFYDGHET
jgi:ribosomal protein S27AE